MDHRPGRLVAQLGLGLYIKFYESKGPNTEEAKRQGQNVINFERDALEGIGIPTPENFVVAEPKMRRQADELSEEWVRLYDEGAATKTLQKG